jgi:DNA polymerase alpha subunit B
LKDSLTKREGSSLPGGEDFELGTLGLQYVETANRDNSNSKSFRRVHCVPNPCTLRINEVVVGITSTDVLLHTSVNETNGNLPAGSRLARISQHLLQQRSYYPLFPASINLDWQQSWEMPCRPDLLICPSKLSPFAKPVLESTLVVNPGPLTRDAAGGTYAVLQIHPMSRDSLENADAKVELPHNVAQRTSVEVRRV